MKRNNIKLFSIVLTATFSFSSCSDSFLSDKKNYDNVNAGIYNYYSGANARVGDVYAWSLPDPNSDANWKSNCTGNPDGQSKSTEEYSGFGTFVNPEAPMTVMGGTKVEDYFQNQANNIQASVWGRIRNINDVINGISGSTLSETDKDKLLGQVYFFRAWCYYNLVKWYGGVPIVKEVLEPVESSVVLRSSAKDCIDFICDDLDKSATMLTAATTNGGWQSADWGRVTSGTALALKGRVLLLWASPLFNRKNDITRWNTAYDEIKKSISVLNSCGYGLYQTSNNINGSDFAQLFSTVHSPEAVFTTLFNIVTSGNGQKNNGWERSIRPKNTTGNGGNEASAMLVDMFPMADGKRPVFSNTYTKLDASDFTYNENYPFMDRDPRFYRTFAFPGTRWAYTGDPTEADPKNPSYNGGKDYALWNYVWYTDVNDQGNAESGNSYGADNLLKNKKGIYVRKRSDDLDVNASTLYSWAATDKNGGFTYSAAPYIEIRYAEVLLNYAEAACGAGHMDEAVEQLQKIRARVGYTSANNFGLQADLTSDQAACMSAVLYERQVELAYEGKRFDDLRRWMLFDGGTSEADGAPETWTLTGWGGNTCTYLGFKPLNGQRRENMEFRVQDSYGMGGTTADSDPLLKANVVRPAAVDYSQPLGLQLKSLKDFYSTTFVRKLKKGDGRDQNHIDETMMYYPRYYFLGLSQGAQSNNTALQQTIGWEDYNNAGSNGTFDPLAE
ncbi:RagB/SusD family nutrient uptake outer membrane protein [uncultured Bacteroides sp.]|uniref:RagB/SusD family nutrient uptake outer membrane protein n=1 Tax=uncultured Bacteroides sp. TaxID=162156 RepID=UPI002AAA6EA1|nr:RagB/SusD family nutrient uptake outer membrane protein [uncultured Bacteroides sp.]